MRTYEEEVAAARERLDKSLTETAADVVVLADRFGKSIHAVSKDVTLRQPELFNAIKARSSRMQKARSEEGSEESSTETPIEVRRARSDLRRPGVVEAVMADPEIRELALSALAGVEKLPAEHRRREARAPLDEVGFAVNEITGWLTKLAERLPYSDWASSQPEGHAAFIENTRQQIDWFEVIASERIML